MNRLLRLGCLAVLALVLVPGVVAGDDKKDGGGGDPGAMGPPPIPAEMEQLAGWVGEWKVLFGETGQPPMEGTYVVRKGLLGRGYIGEFKLPDFEGHAVYTFDPKGKKWHLFWFDCMAPGHVGDWTGELKDGTLTLEAMEDMGQGPMAMRITEKWEGKDKVIWSMSVKQGDAWASIMSGTYTRTK